VELRDREVKELKDHMATANAKYEWTSDRHHSLPSIPYSLCYQSYVWMMNGCGWYANSITSLTRGNEILRQRLDDLEGRMQEQLNDVRTQISSINNRLAGIHHTLFNHLTQ
jgi:DNA anti-recombination protein RmuC